MLDFGFLLWLLARILVTDRPAEAPRQADAGRAEARPTFARDIQPILEKRCQPCHFPGGKMYAKLPFDKGETIHKLGERLFTRIKAEDEQAVIRAFLAQK